MEIHPLLRTVDKKVDENKNCLKIVYVNYGQPLYKIHNCIFNINTTFV